MERRLLNLILIPIKIVVYILFLIIELVLAGPEEDFPVVDKDKE